MIGVAGAIERAFAIQTIVNGIVPATKNLIQEKGQNITIALGDHFQHVSGKALKKDFKIAITNSFGFSSTNCCLIFSAFKEYLTHRVLANRQKVYFI